MQVTVYNFKQFDPNSDVQLPSSYKATRETIVHKLKCEVLEGTGEQVPVEALDHQGRYRRVATGWGELATE